MVDCKSEAEQQSAKRRWNQRCWWHSALEVNARMPAPKLLQMLIRYMSNRKSSCPGERNIRQIDAVRTETCGLARRQSIIDKTVIRRFGPKTVAEIATRSVSADGQVALLLTPLGNEYQELWSRYKGHRHNINRKQRKDAGKHHVWKNQLRGKKSIMSGNYNAVSALLSTSCASDRSMFGGSLASLGTTQEQQVKLWTPKLKNKVKTFSQYRMKRRVEDNVITRDRYMQDISFSKGRLTFKQRHAFAIRRQKFEGFQPSADVNIYLSGVGDQQVVAPFQNIASLFLADLVVVKSLDVVSNLKSGSSDLLDPVTLAASCLGFRVATPSYLAAVQGLAAGAQLIKPEAAALPPSIKFEPIVRKTALLVCITPSFERRHRNTALLVAACCRLERSKWTQIPMAELRLNDDLDAPEPKNLVKLTDDASLKKFHDYCRRHSCVDRNRSSHGKLLPMCIVDS